MKVGVLTASISRQAGGLFWSVRSLARSVLQAGCDVEVFSVADQFSSVDVGQWLDLNIQVLDRCGPAALAYAPGFVDALDQAGPDVLHTHGLWMYPSLAALRFSKRRKSPLVISPRGMLDPWAVRNSVWKKRLAGIFFEYSHLRRATCLHALCKSEYQAIRDFGLTNPVAVIPNGVDLPDLVRSQPAPVWSAGFSDESRILLFLGRIHPKKGLVNLLHGWAKLQLQRPKVAKPWHLVIAGWDQGGHQAELERMATELDLKDQLHFIGPQFGEQKSATLSRADAFILPSFSEGLPMAVLEAWSYGLPVLMTPQCNLPEGFRFGAAIKMEPDTVTIFMALLKLLNLPKTECLAMGQRGRQLVEQNYSWDTIGKDMVSVYEWVLRGGAVPGCIVTGS